MTKKDFLSELGELAFATRLKRLSERLGKDVSRIYADLELPFEAKWFGLFKLLSSYSPLSVTEAADMLGISHAAVNQLAAQLTKRKLIESVKSVHDDRKRLLRLTSSGRQLSKKLIPVWEVIKVETERLMASIDNTFLRKISEIEAELDKQDMHDRVMIALNVVPARMIEIVPYRPAYKKYFRSINEDWLMKYFGADEEDRRQLDDPNGMIIRKGGQILFARLNGHVVGTCALIKHKGGVLELAKMGVTKDARGNGVGRLLAERIIDLAKSEGAKKLYLLTSPELEAAVALYRRIGFKRTSTTPLSACKYKRCTFAMELKLESTKEK